MDRDVKKTEYQIHASKAIGWYIDIMKRIGKKVYVQKEVAKHVNFSESTLSRKIIKPEEAKQIIDKSSITKNDKRTLAIEEAEKICEAMGTTLIDVLYFFQHKDFYEKNLSVFDKCQNLTKSLTVLDTDLENDVDAIQKDITSRVSERAKINGINETNNLISDISHPDFLPWIGRHYCYFTSTSSNEAGKEREHALDKNSDNPETQELLKITPKDYIFCAILDVHEKDAFDDDYCHVSFRFLADPIRLIKKEYEGILVISKIRNAVFCELTGDAEGEKSYLIIEKKEVGVSTSTYANCSIAMVLTLSSREGHRRPCCERMIISRDVISENTERYKIMKANLFMNDDTIRITQWGYNELIKEIEQSGDSTLKEILEKFPDIEKFDSNIVPVEKCAFIPEAYINKLNVLSTETKRKFEIMLRLHSIAAWYYKTKSTKINDLIHLDNLLNP